jgi:SAM-dependent methyltransferase
VARRLAAACVVGVLALAGTAQRSTPQTPPARGTPPPTPPHTVQPVTPLHPPDVIFLPSDDAVVDGMLKLAGVRRDDVVYDLGCGDGKIVIAAARKYGARAVGVDIDPERIKEATANVQRAGVGDKVSLVLGDIFDPGVTIHDATVVTLFLLPSLNQKLRPRLMSDLAPGTRIVSNSFDMGSDWPPAKTEHVGNFTIYLWTIPKRATGD